MFATTAKFSRANPRTAPVSRSTVQTTAKMSRIGKQTIQVPEKTTVTIKGNDVVVKVRRSLFPADEHANCFAHSPFYIQIPGMMAGRLQRASGWTDIGVPRRTPMRLPSLSFSLSSSSPSPGSLSHWTTASTLARAGTQGTALPHAAPARFHLTGGERRLHPEAQGDEDCQRHPRPGEGACEQHGHWRDQWI